MPSYAFHFTRMFHAQNREEYFLDNWKVNFQSYHMHEKFKCMVMLRESFTFYGLINYRHLILKQRNNISLRIMTILTNIPTKFFFLVEKVIFSSSIFTFYRRPLSIWFLQPLWDGRWSSTKQYEKEKFFSWKYVGIVVFFIHVMVVQGSLILFFFIFYFSFSCINNYKTCLCCYFDLKRKIFDVEVAKLRYFMMKLNHLVFIFVTSWHSLLRY